MNESIDNAVDLESEQRKPKTVKKNNTKTSSIGKCIQKDNLAKNSNGFDGQKSAELNASVNTDGLLGQKRKRGRPPKVKNNTVIQKKRPTTKNTSKYNFDDSESDGNESFTENDQEKPTIPAVKKTGKSKKKLKYISSDSDDDDAIESKSKCKKLKVEDGSTEGAVEDVNKQSENGNSNHTEDRINGKDKRAQRKKRTGSGYTAFAINHIFKTLGSTNADSR